MKVYFTLGLLLFGASFSYGATDICVNDRVIDGSSDVGTIVAIYSNGKAKVKFDRFSAYTRSIKELSKSAECKGRFCVNDRVIDGSSDVGKIEMIFENGKAKVKFDRFSALYTRTLSELSKGFRCIEGACVGDG